MGNSGGKDTNETKYRIVVKTNGGYKNAGSNSCAYLNMLGERSGSSTGWIRLRKIMRNDLKKGKTDTFTVKALNIGMPLLIRLELRHSRKMDRWACDDVIIQYDGQEIRFPVHDWVEDEITILRGDAIPSHNIKDMTLRSHRTREVELSKTRFQWIHRPTASHDGWGMPRYAGESFKDLPNIFHYADDKTKHVIATSVEARVATALGKLKKFIGGLDDLESFASLYEYLQDEDEPEFPNRWKSDEEFGWQQMNGISPLSYSRCNKIPECCRISNTHVSGFFMEGSCLEEEIKRGTIYIADYSSVFQGVKRNTNANGEQLYCPDAICLYHVNKERNLLPIAIQLVPNDADSIFTPKDSEEDWLLAKMYFKVAVGNLHEWYYHFFLTHNVAEPFCISVFRCFPRSHPIYKLMRPHLQTVAFINTLARESLLKPETDANSALAIDATECSRKSFKTFKLSDIVLPEILKNQGLDDPSLLPNNFYRDDALKLWGILKLYVTDVLEQYYTCDEDVELDDDIQAFAKDLVYEGFGWEDGNNRGIPMPIKYFSELVRLCTSVIFISSVQHAVVNFPQYDNYKFVPQSPLAMRLPPHKKGEATQKRIMDSLPDKKMATITITIAYTLSSYSSDEVFLGEFPMKLFTECKIQNIQDKFKENLDNFTLKVNERNSRISRPYSQLLPSKIPSRIAI